MKKIDVKNEKVKTQDALLVRQFPLILEHSSSANAIISEWPDRKRR